MHLTPDKWKNNHRFLPARGKKKVLFTPRVTKAFEFSIKPVCQGGKRAKHVPGAGKEYIYHTSTSSTTLNEKDILRLLKRH